MYSLTDTVYIGAPSDAEANICSRTTTESLGMPAETAIEWTEATWNPVTGCTKVSPGCAHCYAETFAERLRGVPGHPYEQGFDLRLWPSASTSRCAGSGRG